MTAIRDPKFRYATEKNLKGKGLKRSASESAEVPDETYMDGLICREAEKALREYGENSSSFFFLHVFNMVSVNPLKP